jgi:hypothetical protein
MLKEIDGDNFNSSMIINENEGSMIINDSSMVAIGEKEKTSTYLSYISGLKKNEN